MKTNFLTLKLLICSVVLAATGLTTHSETVQAQTQIRVGAGSLAAGAVGGLNGRGHFTVYFNGITLFDERFTNTPPTYHDVHIGPLCVKEGDTLRIILTGYGDTEILDPIFSLRLCDGKMEKLSDGAPEKAGEEDRAPYVYFDQTFRFSVPPQGTCCIKVPLGGFAIGCPSECLKVYVPDREGGRLTLFPQSGITVTDLKYPDGSPYQNGADTGPGRHGWYTFKLEGRDFISAVSSRFIQEGEAETVPWNFWYFPFLRREGGGRAGPRMYDQPGPMTKYGDFFPELGAGPWQIELAPHAIGGVGHVIDDVAQDLGAQWTGHCSGLAAASILFRQPVAFGDFTQEDLEGLAGELLNDILVPNDLMGDCGDEFEFEKPKRADTDRVDRKVHCFHNALVKMLRQNRKPFLIDLRQVNGTQGPDTISEVWNQGCYKYTAEMREDPDALGDPEKEKVLQIRIVTRFICNDDFFDAEVGSIGNPKDTPNFRREQRADYVLMYDDQGKVRHNGVVAGRKQNWLSMLLIQANGGSPGVELFAPRVFFDVTEGLRWVERGVRGLNSNANVTLDRLITLGLRKNPGF